MSLVTHPLAAAEVRPRVEEEGPLVEEEGPLVEEGARQEGLEGHLRREKQPKKSAQIGLLK